MANKENVFARRGRRGGVMGDEAISLLLIVLGYVIHPIPV
jgi:hypothetical protein